MKGGKIKMIRKAALQIGAPALLGFMAWNAYLAVNHLKQTQKIAALTLESSMIQADISGVLKDLTDMETGQRGYLLTENPSYLQPYSDAKGRLGTDMANLRIALSSLSLAETRSARLDRERNASLRKALAETIIANSCLLLLTICLFGLMRYHGQVLEQEAAQSKQELAVRDLQLEKLNFALSNQARSKTWSIEANARLLLENYGGFLPRQGHEYAEQIKEASAQMEQLRQDLVGSPDCKSDAKAA